MTSNRTRVIFTIISRNYLAAARVLMHSVQAFEPAARRVVILVDDLAGIDAAAEPFEIVPAAALGIEPWPHFSLKYDILELNTAVKPWAFAYLRAQGAGPILYFDPDIRLYQPLAALWALLDSHLCVLTPHITEPVDDEFYPGELDFLRVGAYNLGFFGLGAHPQAAALLAWWQARLYDRCTREIERGLFVDQHWMDLVPSLFQPTAILRDPGCNAAYWNLHQRQIERGTDGVWRANGAPLTFFHFSGYSALRPDVLSKHQNRLHLRDLPAAAQTLFREYGAALLENGLNETSRLPYAYGQFSDGVPIPEPLRLCLRLHDPRGERWPDPYALDDPQGFRRWAVAPGALKAHARLSPYALALYRLRPDVQSAFPVLGRDDAAFAAWLSAQKEPADWFHPALIDPLRTARTSSAEATAYTTAPAGFAPGRARRLSDRLQEAAALYRAYPRLVNPIAAEQALRSPPPPVTSTTGLYGQARWWLHQTGLRDRARRLVGMRAILTTRQFLQGDARDSLLLQHAPVPSPAAAGAQESRPAVVIPDPQPGVTIVGYLAAETGIGQVARNTIAALQAVDFPLTTVSVHAGEAYQHAEGPAAQASRIADGFVHLYQVNADQTAVVYHQLGEAFYRDRYNIGCWFWELEDFPEQWVDMARTYHEIWAASRFICEALQRRLSTPVTHVPTALAPRPIPPADRQRLGLPDDRFLILYSFDALSIIERKNPLGALAAYQQAFSAHERQTQVQFILKAINLDRAPDGAAVRAAVDAAGAVLIERFLSRAEADTLLASADVYLSLHRSEGLGLGMAEAMRFGKPVIATAYSGNMDFMTETNSFLVPYQRVALGRDYPPYPASAHWAEPDLETAAAMLRRVFLEPDTARERGARAAADIQRQYAPETVGQHISARLDRILAYHGHPRADGGAS